MSGQKKDEIIYDQEGNVVQPSTTPTTSTAAPSTPQIGTGQSSTAYQQGAGVYQKEFDTNMQTAAANRDAGNLYAQNIKDMSYKSAEAARNEANRLADVNYQRNVIDSQSSYQKAVGAYGSNAETLASNGLSGSGYGEWLQGNAYATHRGQVQAAGAQKLSTQKEAAYNEQQTKLAADQTYGQFLYQNDVQYRNDVAAAKKQYDQQMYQLGLGLSAEQNATYNDLFSKAASGQSIESIMQDGRWGDLTADQQKVITDRASKYISDADAAKQLEQKYINDDNYMSWLDAVNSGSYSLADVQAISGYKDLEPEQKVQLENAAAQAAAKESAKKREDLVGRIIDYAAMLESGMSLEHLKEIMTMNQDDYDTLDVTMQAVLNSAAARYNAAQKELEELKAAQATEDRRGQILALAGLASNGYSEEAINKYIDFYQLGDLTDDERAVINVEIAKYTNAQNEIQALQDATKAEDRRGQILALAGLASDGYTAEDIEKHMSFYGITNVTDPEWAIINTEIRRYNEAKEKIDSENTVNMVFGYAELASSGWTLEDIKNAIEASGGNYDDFNEAQQAVITNAIAKYTAAQDAIKSEVATERAYGYAGLIEAGWNLDDVKALIGEEEYEKLGDAGKRIIETTASVFQRIKEEAEAKAKEDEENAKKYADDENYLNWSALIRSGQLSIEDLEKTRVWKELDEDMQIALKGIAEEYKETEKNAIVESVKDYGSAEEVTDILTSWEIPEDEREEIVSDWQSSNADDFIEILGSASLGNTPKIGDEPLDLTEILNDVNNNLYGDRTPDVMNKLVWLIVRCGIRDGATEADVKVMQQVLSQIESFWNAYDYPDKYATNNKIKKGYSTMAEYLTRLQGPSTAGSTTQGSSGATR